MWNHFGEHVLQWKAGEIVIETRGSGRRMSKILQTAGVVHVGAPHGSASGRVVQAVKVVLLCSKLVRPDPLEIRSRWDDVRVVRHGDAWELLLLLLLGFDVGGHGVWECTIRRIEVFVGVIVRLPESLGSPRRRKCERRGAPSALTGILVGCGPLLLVARVLLASWVSALVRHQIAPERELQAASTLNRLSAQLLVVPHVNLHSTVILSCLKHTCVRAMLSKLQDTFECE
jgi:hypothetical protein